MKWGTSWGDVPEGWVSWNKFEFVEDFQGAVVCKFGVVFYILKSFRVRKITLHPKKMLLRHVV